MKHPEEGQAMDRKWSILMVSAEAHPFAKVGAWPM